MSGKLSRVRLYLMRSAYLFNAVVIGFGAWSELTNQRRLINWRKALGPYLWHCLQPLRSLCTADAFGCAIPCANAALVVAKVVVEGAGDRSGCVHRRMSAWRRRPAPW